MIKLLSEYISHEEEALLLSRFKKTPVVNTMDRNSVVRYGSILPYKTKVNPTIPQYWDFLLQRLKKHDIIDADSITVNEYHPRQAISWHVDSESSGPAIIVLSLKGTAVMQLRPLTNKQQITSYVLPPRSLLIMDGEERYEWEHSLKPLEEHRYSIVFRKGTYIKKKSNETARS